MNRLLVLSGFGVKSPACFRLEIAGWRLLFDLGEGLDFDTHSDISGPGRHGAVKSDL